MIQEYLFIGDDNLKDLNALCIKEITLEVEKIQNSDCIIVKYSTPNDDIKSAKLLSDINEKLLEMFNPIILTSESSAYFNKRLFPIFNEFERKLRKLLYLKSALNSSEKANENISDLEGKDLGKIFMLLFADTKFDDFVRQYIKNTSGKFTKVELIDLLQKTPENTLWDKLIGKESAVTLPKEFIKVRTYRNDTMHAHNIGYKLYDSAFKLINKINQEIDDEIDKAIGQKEENTEPQSSKDFNSVLSDALSIYNYLNNVQAAKRLIESVGNHRLLDIGTDPEVQRIIEEQQILHTYISSPEFLAIQKALNLVNTYSPEVLEKIQRLSEDFKVLQKVGNNNE